MYRKDIALQETRILGIEQTSKKIRETGKFQMHSATLARYSYTACSFIGNARSIPMIIIMSSIFRAKLK